MSKIDEYRDILRSLDDWDAFLLSQCGLPGPRANLELAHAVAEEGDETLFRRYLMLDAAQAPANSPGEFLAVCGVVGFGRLLAEGRADLLVAIRLCASDSRWRVREGVCMALQRLGRVNMDALLIEMDRWSQGSLLERRAAAAAVCEPQLLGVPKHTRHVLSMLDQITASLMGAKDRKRDEFRILRQALGYCWSVAVVALPSEGKEKIERWILTDDSDIRWIMRENLKKKRLERMDAAWVARWKAAI